MLSFLFKVAGEDHSRWAGRPWIVLQIWDVALTVQHTLLAHICGKFVSTACIGLMPKLTFARARSGRT